ncbi:MAG: hypothetical protein HY822_04720, partial [Acidobacteria bacterium]|nr:hypothetical protein [Acidobacteriota bacterium]
PRDHLDDVLKPLAQSAGVEALDFQMLRRTCATYFRQDVKSAQAQLRHSTPATTAGVYQQTISADHRAAVEALDAEFTGRAPAEKLVVLQPRRAK